MTVLKAPTHLSVSRVPDFLHELAFVFQLNGKQVREFHLDVARTKKLSLLAQLIIFKFISYSSENRCFSDPRVHWHPTVLEQLQRDGFLRLIQLYSTKRSAREILKAYRDLSPVTRESFFIAPQRLLRSESSARAELEEQFLTRAARFYDENRVTYAISTCLAELLTNFWEHATEDAGTVMVARGDKHQIEIVFADNGQGVVTTLSNSGRHANPSAILGSSIQKGVTSKPGTFHTGSGLWIVSQIVKMTSGLMHLISEGGWVRIQGGRISQKPGPYWKGTIVYIRLDIPLLSTSKQLPIRSTTRPGLLINWGGESR
jgi:anti-sigma regulatory factor (Ser/Thr protein kinase)